MKQKKGAGDIEKQAIDIAKQIVKELNADDIALYVAPIPFPTVTFKTTKAPDISSAIEDLEAKHEAGVDAVKSAVDIRLTANMRRTWGWIDGSRDIVDTGALMDSVQFADTGDGFSLYYGEPYANLVHYGGYINPYGNPNARVYLPARPWVELTFSEMNNEWQQIYLNATR